MSRWSFATFERAGVRFGQKLAAVVSNLDGDMVSPGYLMSMPINNDDHHTCSSGMATAPIHRSAGEEGCSYLQYCDNEK